MSTSTFKFDTSNWRTTLCSVAQSLIILCGAVIALADGNASTNVDMVAVGSVFYAIVNLVKGYNTKDKQNG
jgi:hypothetical protein